MLPPTFLTLLGCLTEAGLWAGLQDCRECGRQHLLTTSLPFPFLALTYPVQRPRNAASRSTAASPPPTATLNPSP